MMKRSLFVAFSAVLALAPIASAQLPEIETNETKAQALANGAFVLSASGPDTFVTGTTTGSSTTAPGAASADTFLIQTAALPLGIYQHQLTLTSTTVGHSGSIRGLSQSTGVINTTSDIFLQSSSTTTSAAQPNSNLAPRSNRWYGFGKGEQIYYRVTGTATTAAAYSATLTTNSVTPVNAGTFQEGTITITSVGLAFNPPTGTTQTDTDMWVYDSAFNAIPNFGNDDRAVTQQIPPNNPSSSLGSFLRRTFTPGLYCIGISTFQFANNQPAPTDDNFRSGNVLDFPDAAANSSSLPTTASPADIGLSLSITDACGSVTTSALKPGSYGIFWACFAVLPAPAPVPGPWETNDASCTLRVNSGTNTSSSPIDQTVCTNTFGRLFVESTRIGFDYDIAVTIAPGVAGPTACGPGGGGILTPGGQDVNIDVTASDLSFLFGGLDCINPSPNPFPGNYHIPFTVPSPVTNVSGQMIICNPGFIDGVCLSSLNQLHIVAFSALAAPVTLPDLDDTAVAFGIGCFPFYSTGFTQITVSTNSRIQAGLGNNDWTGTPLAALGQAPSFGAWTDLAANLAAATATITASSPAANLFRVQYSLVPYFGAGTTSSSYEILLDANTGSVTLDGLTGFDASLGALGPDMFLGISKGNLGGTDAGPSAFSPAGTVSPANATDMIYEAGPAGTLAPGINTITFMPINVGGALNDTNYTATSL